MRELKPWPELHGFASQGRTNLSFWACLAAEATTFSSRYAKIIHVFFELQ
jgi:hypothetical protein